MLVNLSPPAHWLILGITYQKILTMIVGKTEIKMEKLAETWNVIKVENTYEII